MKRNLQIYIQVNTFFFFTNVENYWVSIVRGVCNFLDSVSSQQKFEAKDQCYNPWMDQCCSPRTDQCYSSQMNQCYSSVLFRKLRKIHPRGVRACRPKRPKDAKRRERHPWPFGSSFYMFFLLPLDLPYVNWASQECYLFYLRSSLWSWGISLFYFHGLFLPLSFSHCHSGLSFTILTT